MLNSCRICPSQHKQKTALSEQSRSSERGAIRANLVKGSRELRLTKFGNERFQELREEMARRQETAPQLAEAAE
jgi:hypothetical protein